MGPGGGSVTPPITVPIQSHVINAKEISDEIFKAFQAGLTQIMKSKKFQVGMRNVFRTMGSEMEKAMARSGNTIANQITKALGKIPGAAQAAAKGSAGAFNHMIPHSAQASVDRLIKQFDRLDKVLAGLGGPNVRLEHTLSQLNKSIARTTSEAARQQTAAQNTAIQQQTSRANNAAKQRVVIFQAMVQQIRALERGLGAAIKFSIDIAGRAVRGLGNAYRRMGESARAGARAAVSAIKGIATAMAGVTRGVARMSAGLATGFARGFGRISSALVGALRRDEGHLRSSLSRRERMVSASASRQSSLLSRVTSPQGLAAITGGAGLGSILTGGFERFANIERLQFQFERLLGSETEAAAMLERISEFARTTSFDLTGVAGLATNFVAMGQSADQTMQSIQSLADVTAFAGGNTESLERIQRALGQIVSTGRLQGDELNQLAENLPGINIRQIIADQLGVSTAELVAMQEAGELDAETFINAFLQGIDDPRFNGAAQEIAKTLSGRLANLKETFDIFGASLVGLVADPLRQGMEEVTTILTGIGDFISGEMFKEQENPFAGMKPDAEIMFGDLPAEMQEILARDFGWDETNFISAEDAAGLWEQLNPPDPMMEKLRELRDMVGDFAKGAGLFLGVLGGFKLLAVALGFLISPLTILTGLFGLLGVFWGRITKASGGLKGSLKIVGQHFGALKESLKATLGLVTGLISTALFGDSDFFKNIGDKVSFFTNMLGAGINQFRQWVDWANEMLKIGEIGKIVDSASQSFQGFLSNILGLTDAQLAAAQELGGNDFGNIFTAFLDKLENVPVLGPILRFVRRIVNTVADVVRQFAGFIGDIWNSIFGGESTVDAVGGLFGDDTEGETRSAATRFLDTVEGTFLGPVVRFFRGPFADAVEGVGNFVGGLFNAIFNPEEGTEDQSIITRVADFLAENGLKGLIDFLRGDALSEAYNNVVGFFTPMLNSVWGAIQSAYNIIKPIVKPLTDWVGKIIDAFRDRDFEAFDFGKIALGAGIGLLAGAVVAGPIGAIAGAGIGAAFGAGLGDAIKKTVANVWTTAAKPALDKLWAAIAGFAATTFTAENLGKAATFLLDLMYEAGHLVATIATDKRFVGAIAGVAAAGAVVVAKFTQGLVQGLAEAYIEWGRLIADYLVLAWNTLTSKDGALDFVPDPIVNAVDAALNNATAGILALASIGILGTAIVKAVIGGITKFAPSLVSGAGGIVGMIFGKKQGTGGVFDQDKQKKTFETVGQGIAGAVIGGILSFSVGMAAGKEGSAGSLVLALLTGGVTGAALGFQIAGPLGAAIGAGLGVAAAGVGAYFGTASREAEKAKQEVNEYAEALMNVTAAELIPTAAAIVIENIKDESEEVVNILDAMQFDAEKFAGDILAGADPGAIFTEWMQNIPSAADFQALTEGQRGAILDFIGVLDEANLAGTEFTDEFLADAILRGGSTLRHAFEAMGLDVGDFVDVLDVARDEGGEMIGGLEKARSLEGFLDPATASAEALETQILSVDEVAEELASRMELFDGTKMTASFDLVLAQSGLTVQEQVRAVEQAANDAEAALDEMKAAAAEALGGPAMQTLEDSLRDFRLGLEGFGMEGEVVLGVNTDKFQDQLDGVRDSIAGALAQGMADGTIDSEGEFATFIDGLRTGVEESGLGPAAQAELQAMIDEFEAAGILISWDDIADTEADVAAAREYARLLSGAISETLSTGATFTGAATVAGQAAAAAAPTAPTINSDIDVSGFRTVGEDANKEVQEGFEGKEGELTTSMNTVVANCATAVGTTGATKALGAGQKTGNAAVIGVLSKSGAMFNAGYNVSASMAQGISSAGWLAVAAAAAVARRVVAAALSVLQIHSPSQVFVGIGHDIGEGFMLGIEDMEGDMMGAISSAITNAIGEAQATAESAAAQAGAAIFQAMFPSELPGGATHLDIQSAQAAIRQQVGGFGAGARSAAAESFGNQETAAVSATARVIQGMAFQMRLGFADVVSDVKDALAHSKEIADWDAAMKKLKADFKSGALGAEAHRVAWTALIKEWNAGLITTDQYKDSLEELNKKLKAGILNQEAYNDALSDLGDRPAPLSIEERNLITSGATSLNPSTFAGIANAETINTALEGIANWAQAALESGASVASVQSTVDRYVKTLQDQAKAAGLSATEVNKLITAMGLMPTQIAAWVTGLTSLNAATAEGQVNIQMINEQLDAIRQYGLTLLEAGFSAETVKSALSGLRDELVTQATTFGFSAAGISALVDAAGLSTAALDAFITEMQAFATEAKNAAAAAEAAAKAAADKAAADKLAAEEAAADLATPLRGPAVENLNIYIPYGDPEAVGMAAANRIAYNSLTSW